MNKFLLSGLILTSSGIAQEKPNVIFILADDLGYTDVNYFASRITNTPAEKQYYETPNIDRLAKQGIAFEQAYACPLSSPTRSSLLTGKYASRLGFQTATAGDANTYYIQGLEPPASFHEQDITPSSTAAESQAIINGTTLIALPSGQPQDKGRDEITFAEAMKDYQAAFLGKWHVGGHGSEGYQPNNQGFEELDYFDSGSSQFYNWKATWNRKQKYYPKMRQTELMQGKSVDDQIIPYLTDNLTQRALDYIDNRTADLGGKPFILYFNHFAVHAPIQAPESTIRYFNNKTTKGWKGHNNATYAAMIKHLDTSVGRIMDKLIEKGIDKNTIIIFMSDNGGITVGNGGTDIPITDNSPLNGQKANVYEGGIRVPLIISYNGKVEGGKWSNVVVDVNDLFPTLLELTGQPKATHQIDGQSIAGLLTDTNNINKSYTRETHFWHYPYTVGYKNPEDKLQFTPQSAVRKGDYKLIFDWYGRLRLYNIKEDISETTNLSKIMPEKTRELYVELINYLENNVEKKYWPKPNPAYNPEMELRRVQFVDLYKAYKEGKDIVELSDFIGIRPQTSTWEFTSSNENWVYNLLNCTTTQADGNLVVTPTTALATNINYGVQGFGVIPLNTNLSHIVFKLKNQTSATSTNFVLWAQILNADGVTYGNLFTANRNVPITANSTGFIEYSVDLSLFYSSNLKFFFENTWRISRMRFDASFGASSTNKLELDYVRFVQSNTAGISPALESSEKAFQLYPVPASKGGVLSLMHNEMSSRVLEVSVLDLQGRMVQRVDIKGQNNIQIPTSGLNSGAYFVSIKTVGNQIFKKFVVN